jgi:hypothetical protein
LLHIKREQLEVCRHDGWRQRVDLSRSEGAYSLGELAHHLVNLVSGRGVRIYRVTWLLARSN